ncbi:MAG: queuosine salvage family protein [Patescibacteria group bacterium]|nr:queuosine salvage family protein [Patescibacteria group bacterium]MDE2438047.1 queuosine salvage family protein [Patescibacteria group bacterium]
MNKVLETTKLVIDQSQFVRINQDKVLEFAKNFDHTNVQHWLSAAPFGFSELSDDDKLNFLFVFNALSFSYWGNPKWTITYKDQQFDGAWGMIVALKRAIDEGRDILSADYRSKMSRQELAEILRGNSEIPLLNERHVIMVETGKALIAKNNGNFSDFILQANKDAVHLLEFIIETFPSFRDVSIYKGKEIDFYKRAQLLIADIYQLFKHQGPGDFKNANEITACADYKLPQALRKFGILSYVDSLAEKIDSKTPIPHDSEEEIEIRANTIWAVEFIKQEVQKRFDGITSMDINDHLWLYTQTKYPDDKPYHLTRTTAY